MSELKLRPPNARNPSSLRHGMRDKLAATNAKPAAPGRFANAWRDKLAATNPKPATPRRFPTGGETSSPLQTQSQHEKRLWRALLYRFDGLRPDGVLR